MSYLTVKEDRLKLVLEGPREVLNQIRDSLRFRPKGYMFSPKFELWRLTDGKEGWDGYLCPMQRVSLTQAVLPRGYRDEVVSLANLHGFELEAQLMPRPLADLTLADIRPDVIRTPYLLDEYQRRAVLAWLVEVIGISHMTVSGGKTATFCAAAQIVKDHYPKTRFIYVTPSERLVRQVTKSAREYLPDFEVGQFGGGKHEKDAADMVVCTVAVLHRNIAELTRSGWFRTFNALLFDEVQYCGSQSAERVLACIPSFWRFGASDTIKEDDPARHAKMIGQFGSILTKVDATPHIESGRLATPFIYVEELLLVRDRFKGLPFNAEPGTTAWCLLEGQWKQGTYLGPVTQLDENGNAKTRRKFSVDVDDDGRIVKVSEMVNRTETGLHSIKLGDETYTVESRWVLLDRAYDQAIVNFKERNERIVKWVRYYAQNNRTTLVVATRTLHIYILESMIRAVVDPDRVRILFGWATSLQRDEAFAWFREVPGRVLITPLVKVGVSINEINAGVIADCVGDAEAANQIVGRFLRAKPDPDDNRAEITWFRDVQHPALRVSSTRVITNLAWRKYNVYSRDTPDVDQLLSGAAVSPADWDRKGGVYRPADCVPSRRSRKKA